MVVVDYSQEAQKTKWGDQRKASCTLDSYRIWFVARDWLEIENFYAGERDMNSLYIAARPLDCHMEKEHENQMVVLLVSIAAQNWCQPISWLD